MPEGKSVNGEEPLSLIGTPASLPRQGDGGKPCHGVGRTEIIAAVRSHDTAVCYIVDIGVCPMRRWDVCIKS